MVNEEELNWAMFNVKVRNNKGEVIERKASDALEQLQWMIMMEKESCVLMVDPEKSAGMSFSDVQSRAFQALWIKQKSILQDALGIGQDDSDEDENEDEDDIVEEIKRSPEPIPKPKSTPEPEPSPKVVSEPETIEGDFFDSTPKAPKSSDDEIVL